MIGPGTGTYSGPFIFLSSSCFSSSPDPMKSSRSMKKKKNSSGFLLAGIDARFVKLGKPKRNLGLGVWGHLLSDHLQMPPLTALTPELPLGWELEASNSISKTLLSLRISPHPNFLEFFLPSLSYPRHLAVTISGYLGGWGYGFSFALFYYFGGLSRSLFFFLSI